MHNKAEEIVQVRSLYSCVISSCSCFVAIHMRSRLLFSQSGRFLISFGSLMLCLETFSDLEDSSLGFKSEIRRIKNRSQFLSVGHVE